LLVELKAEIALLLLDKIADALLIKNDEQDREQRERGGRKKQGVPPRKILPNQANGIDRSDEPSE
jgi:hypothetical protein